MGPFTIIFLAIGLSLLSLFINFRFKDNYNIFPIAWGPFVFQTLFLFLIWATRPTSHSANQKAEPSVWFFIWIALAILSFLIGIVMCWKKAGTVGAANGDKYLAVLCQIITPIAILLVFIMILIGMANKQEMERRKKEEEEKKKKK